MRPIDPSESRPFGCARDFTSRIPLALSIVSTRTIRTP
jgi:hypothetical protein